MWFLETLTRSINLKYIVLVCLGLLREPGVIRGENCQIPAKGALQFTGSQFTQEVIQTVRTGQINKVHCCANGYDSLHWYKYYEKSSQWKPFPWYERNSWVRMAEGATNQTLVLDDPLFGFDDGLYKCIASNKTTGEVKERETRLMLIA